jgi:hypothetical protein
MVHSCVISRRLNPEPHIKNLPQSFELVMVCHYFTKPSFCESACTLRWEGGRYTDMPYHSTPMSELEISGVMPTTIRMFDESRNLISHLALGTATRTFPTISDTIPNEGSQDITAGCVSDFSVKNPDSMICLVRSRTARTLFASTGTHKQLSFNNFKSSL